MAKYGDSWALRISSIQFFSATQSASMKAMILPCAAEIPIFRASPGNFLSAYGKTLTSGNSFLMSSLVPSVEESTTMISKLLVLVCSPRDSRQAAMVPLELYEAMTTETSGFLIFPPYNTSTERTNSVSIYLARKSGPRR